MSQCSSEMIVPQDSSIQQWIESWLMADYCWFTIGEFIWLVSPIFLLFGFLVHKLGMKILFVCLFFNSLDSRKIESL